MKSWGKIALGVRCGGAVDAAFFACWTDLILNGLRDKDCVYKPAIEMPAHHAANSVANSFAVSNNTDSLLFIDDDMVFNRDDLNLLRDNASGQEYDILQGLYLTRSMPHQPQIYTDNLGECIRATSWPVSGCVDSEYVGLGFTLIRKSAFMAIASQPDHDNFFNYTNTMGEDVYFCYKAKKAGLKIGVCCDVRIGHRIRNVISPHGTDEIIYNHKSK